MKETPCIRIGHLKIVDHLIIGIAHLQIKKKEVCLAHSNLETRAMNSWEQVCDALKEGEINGAFISSPMAMDLFSSGLDISALMFTHRSGSMIVKSRASGIRNIADFKGKTMLVPSELCVQTMLVHRLLSSAGLNLSGPDDIRADVVREVVPGYLMSKMLGGDQDNDIAGFIVSDPFGNKAIQNGSAAKVCTTQSLWEKHPDSLFVLNSSFVEQYPEAVQELIHLFAQTGQFIEGTENDTLLSMACSFLDQDKTITGPALLESQVHFDPSSLVPDLGALDMIQDYMADVMGVLKNKTDLNLLVSPSFISNTLSENNH